MKVLITSIFIPPIAGGAEQVVWETAVRLAKHKDLEVHILTIGKEGIEYKDGITIHRIPNKPLKELYYSTLGYKKIKRIMDKNKFDLIHFHIILPWAFVMRKVSGKKIITCHGGEVMDYNFIRTLLGKISVKHADVVTAPSNYFTKLVKEKYGVECLLIPNGVDTKFFRPIKKTKKNNTILYVGRFIERKGIMELLNVANKLKEYTFLFVGKGDLSKEITLTNTFDLGFKNSKELLELYPESEICVFPSHWENLPIVGLEAMSCGKAIIATKLGFSEIIENNKEGIIIEPKNERELEYAIKRLMNNKNLIKELEKNARKRALNYDWDVISKKYYDLYKRVLK